MPLYDYQCNSCEHTFSELRRGSEKDDPISCPDCGNRENRRLVTGFSIGAAPSASIPSCGSGGCPSANSCPSASNFGCMS